MQVSPFLALLMSFVTWFSIGFLLLYKGLKILVDLVRASQISTFLHELSRLLGGRETAVLCYIFLALFVGFLKGRFVLSKTVSRLATRFYSYGRPMLIKEVYPSYYLAIIGSMMLLGMSIRWLPIPQELRGIVDVAVGSSLINGSLQYVRIAFAKDKKLQQ